MYCSRVSIDTFDRPWQSTLAQYLDQQLINILINTQSTLGWYILDHLDDLTPYVDRQQSVDWLILYIYWLKLDDVSVKISWLSIGAQPRCSATFNQCVNWVSNEGQSRVLIEAIIWHPTVDAFSCIHDLQVRKSGTYENLWLWLLQSLTE